MSRASKSNVPEWQPAASIDTLKRRAQLLAQIRAFFAARGVWEVETPLLCRTTVTAPYLHSLALSWQQQSWYLQTSPEYAMKRLLAAGSGPIYQISKAFRADESGRLHQPEFTLLEWYRPDFTHHQLMDEMDVLLQTLLNFLPARRFSYEHLFQHFLQISPHEISCQQLQQIAQKCQLHLVDAVGLEKDDWLQLLLTHVIEPQLTGNAPFFIYDFPVSQAALAKIRADNPPVAERFEVYYQKIELANGYHELTDAQEQRQRFKQDLLRRQQLNYPVIAMDEYLLAALPSMPACAGVALGVDRLVMLALQKSSIQEVLAFTVDNC